MRRALVAQVFTFVSALTWTAISAGLGDAPLEVRHIAAVNMSIWIAAFLVIWSRQ